MYIISYLSHIQLCCILPFEELYHQLIHIVVSVCHIHNMLHLLYNIMQCFIKFCFGLDLSKISNLSCCEAWC